ncbi:MAG: ATP-binding domain-containing protein, partial [Gammaproteobacteria bacterium]|nr:ATP-binding domain-containing protein [Gammaproteobacteria bacterium]
AQDRNFNPRAAGALSAFLTLIDTLDREIRGLTLGEQVEHALQRSGLLDHYRQEKGEVGQARVENLEELVNAARAFQHEAVDEGMDPLAAFLAHAALEAGEGQGEPFQDCVQIMTLHSAKGLEFPVVFMCGMEDGLFPHQLSLEEPGRLEEERRLCYVGMTRARRTLVFTYAERRRLHGTETYPQPSRFLREIPAELMQEIRPRVSVTRPVYAAPAAVFRSVDEPASGLRLGQRVRHAKFGEGVILNYEGNGAHARVQVNFKQTGSKWLVLSYANLETLP